MQRDINAEANRTLADAIELVLKRYGICGNGHARWALLVYPDEGEPLEVNLISNGKSSRVEHVLLAARELMLGANHQAAAGAPPAIDLTPGEDKPPSLRKVVPFRRRREG